ncbi:uncharacterized protein LOC126824233 [Patella vulgata]|uniref:uncharacterized protein LOC126824233 n=1 Tax=Patella vulgata TaxID=6465 RepID=UPI00217F9645|nr:uncharacterized protein LOC126824233 [Patella vulgata]
MSTKISQLWIYLIFIVLFVMLPIHVISLRQLLEDNNGISKSPDASKSPSPLVLQKIPGDITRNNSGVKSYQNVFVPAKHMKGPDNDSPVNSDSKNHKTKALNLTILPILAVLAFLTCICLKCCKWFRDSVKKREGDDDDETGFVIITEGDNEYNDVEFRSDTTSMGYDTVSSYTSFIRRNNHYDTVTSVRSLQLPRHSDTHNSYRSFLLQRLDGSRQNTVSSYRSFLQNAAEMKDVEVQVELVDEPYYKDKKNLTVDIAPRTYSKPRRYRHSSCDSVILSAPSKRSKSSESSENSTSPNESPNRQSRYIRRSQRHRVSFLDSSSVPRVKISRSLSSAYSDHNTISILNDRRRQAERQASVSPSSSPRRAWESRLSSTNETKTGNLKGGSPKPVHRNENSTENQSYTETTPQTVGAPKNHRFKVCKTELVSVSQPGSRSEGSQDKPHESISQVTQTRIETNDGSDWDTVSGSSRLYTSKPADMSLGVSGLGHLSRDSDQAVTQSSLQDAVTEHQNNDTVFNLNRIKISNQNNKIYVQSEESSVDRTQSQNNNISQIPEQSQELKMADNSNTNPEQKPSPNAHNDLINNGDDPISDDDDSGVCSEFTSLVTSNNTDNMATTISSQ